MAYKLHPRARRQLEAIWRYSRKQWSHDQAGRYIRGLTDAISTTSETPALWRTVVHDTAPIKGIYYMRHQRHYIFFRIRESDKLMGIIAILHDAMDIPSQLMEVVERDDK